MDLGRIALSSPAKVGRFTFSQEDVSIPSQICFAGEVGLSGEIRAVQRVEQRIAEADRLGFKEIYVSKYGMKGIDPGRYGLRIQTLGKVEELKRALFV